MSGHDHPEQAVTFKRNGRSRWAGICTEITLSGLRLRIAGIRTKAPKNNILLTSLDGSGNRVAPLSLVKAALKRSQG